LASQGKAAAQVARDFVNAVERMVEVRNRGKNKLLVLISGRELVVQENETQFRCDKQILTILPYFVSTHERQAYEDKKNLLHKDLRNDWWARYGTLTAKGFNGLPKSLKKHEIDEITAQPLLNYLVALSFARDKLNFNESLNLNDVYADLMTAVYERGYEGKRGRVHESIKHITEKNFVRVMEEVGLAAWHGSDGRAVSLNEIQQHCMDSGMGALIETFTEGAEAGITKLLAAFFFRKSGSHASGDATFVFTHKSFGEYLTAMRIIRGIENIVKQLQQREEDYDTGLDTTEGVLKWAKLLGPAPMTEYIAKFLKKAILKKSREELEKWKESLTDMLEQVIEKRMPMEKIGKLNFFDAHRQCNNASISLVIALNCCAEVLQSLIKIEFRERNSFGVFVRAICPQRIGPDNNIVYQFLSYLDLSGQFLDISDLYRANLRNSYFRGANLHYVNAMSAKFSFADMSGVYLTSARLNGAELISANLSNADLRKANLENANLENANLSGANLSGANLLGAKLGGANLNGANFEKSDLTNVDLSTAQLKQIKVRKST
jgi:uncharacterized protein YjbI with pentapeptide repeats